MQHRKLKMHGRFITFKINNKSSQIIRFAQPLNVFHWHSVRYFFSAALNRKHAPTKQHFKQNSPRLSGVKHTFIFKRAICNFYQQNNRDCSKLEQCFRLKGFACRVERFLGKKHTTLLFGFSV